MKLARYEFLWTHSDIKKVKTTSMAQYHFTLKALHKSKRWSTQIFWKRLKQHNKIKCTDFYSLETLVEPSYHNKITSHNCNQLSWVYASSSTNESVQKPQSTRYETTIRLRYVNFLRSSEVTTTTETAKHVLYPHQSISPSLIQLQNIPHDIINSRMFRLHDRNYILQ